MAPSLGSISTLPAYPGHLTTVTPSARTNMSSCPTLGTHMTDRVPGLSGRMLGERLSSWFMKAIESPGISTCKSSRSNKDIAPITSPSGSRAVMPTSQSAASRSCSSLPMRSASSAATRRASSDAISSGMRPVKTARFLSSSTVPINPDRTISATSVASAWSRMVCLRTMNVCIDRKRMSHGRSSWP